MKCPKTSFSMFSIVFFRCVRTACGRSVLPVGLRYNHRERGTHLHQKQREYSLSGTPCRKSTHFSQNFMSKAQLKYSHSSDGLRISPRWGHQHTILSNFPKNCMKLKEFGSPGEGRIPRTPLDLPLHRQPLFYKTIYRSVTYPEIGNISFRCALWTF